MMTRFDQLQLSSEIVKQHADWTNASLQQASNCQRRTALFFTPQTDGDSVKHDFKDEPFCATSFKLTETALNTISKLFRT